MKRITLQNYYGVRDDNDFVESTQLNRWVIYPDSRIKGFWDILIILLMIYTCTVLPFRLAFYDDSTVEWNTYIYISYIFLDSIMLSIIYL